MLHGAMPYLEAKTCSVLRLLNSRGDGLERVDSDVSCHSLTRAGRKSS